MKTKIFLLIVFSIFIISCKRNKEYLYCGEIISKGYEPPTSGHKSSRDAVYYVMMREDKSQQIIRVNVIVPAWNRLTPGKRACFKLSNFALYEYQNTTDPSKNLYGE